MNLKNVKGFLFDLDGTLYFKGKMISDADKIIDKLRTIGKKIIFITNTDSLPVDKILKRIQSYGINAYYDEVFCPAVAALNFLQQNPEKSAFCLVSNQIRPLFNGINWNDKNPDYVVIGDFRDRVSYPLINQAFRCIMNGAKIITLTRGQYFFTKEGINVDTGAFTALFEYASGKKASVLGKPNKTFFYMALSKIGLNPDEVAIIGDDIQTDILGAKNIGAVGILVKTGKYNQTMIEQSSIKPNIILDSVVDIDTLIDQ